MENIKKKQKPGRKPLGAGMKRDKPVAFVVTKKQYDSLVACANGAGQKLGTWVRSVILGTIGEDK